MNKHIGKVFVNHNKHKRRYRQIGRLIYYYCCVRYMTRVNGAWKLCEWVKDVDDVLAYLEKEARANNRKSQMLASNE